MGEWVSKGMEKIREVRNIECWCYRDRLEFLRGMVLSIKCYMNRKRRVMNWWLGD